MPLVENLFVCYLDVFMVTLWPMQELPLSFAAASHHPFATIG